MEEDYYEITSEINAKDILRYLNDLGIRNISGEVLKYFIEGKTENYEFDLKKFIRYDLQQRYEEHYNKLELPGPERLHSASTFCSRLRSIQFDGKPMKCKGCEKPLWTLNSRKFYSTPNLGVKLEEEQSGKRSCSCIRMERKTDNVSIMKPNSVNSNFIRVPQKVLRKKSDPVSLYHHYTALWAKYKSNVPGENDWAELRWNTRQKMAGCLPNHKNNKAVKKENKNNFQGKII